MPRNLQTIGLAIEAQIERLEGEIKTLEQGDVRFGRKDGDGEWHDRTADELHDRRNLLATLSSLLTIIRKI